MKWWAPSSDRSATRSGWWMSAPAERCEICGEVLTAQAAGRGRAGRPARYCSSACRQRAYRRRTAGQPTDGQREDQPARAEPGAGTAKPPPAAPVAADAPTVPPPLRTVLPMPLDSFVGRGRDLAELADLANRYRLVTLLGPGGAGKTRLVLEHAHRSGGALWVDLASVTDGALLARTVADALSVSEEIGRPVMETLVTALSGRPATLVLDNCEQLVAAAAGLTEQSLRRCPDLSVLVTSRESLDIPGEAVFRVGELSLPTMTANPSAAHVLGSDAVQLFVERARASAPDFALTDDNAGHVAAICAHLDGIPLAIELAARRTRLFPVVEIRARLDDRFRLLTAGPRTAARRHRDLRTTIEWSYDLLEPTEQAVFPRLSLFVGGFGLPVAAAVCADVAGADEMLDVLAGLEAKSLIVPVTAGRHGGRFRQLESIRLYGRERLVDAG